MDNALNTGDLETLTPGNSLLVQAVATSTEKVQLEIAEIIEESERGTNLLSVFNKSDDRFQRRPRRAWMTVEAADAEELLGLKEGTLTAKKGWKKSTVGRSTKKKVRPLNIMNPEIPHGRLVLQVTETTTPDSYQAANVEERAKRRGADGPYMLHNGKHIFSNTEVVLESSRKHTFLQTDEESEAVVDVNTGEIWD